MREHVANYEISAIFPKTVMFLLYLIYKTLSAYVYNTKHLELIQPIKVNPNNMSV